jgi:hypothetical protein
MNKKLDEYKKSLEEDISLLGYEQLRYSIFADESSYDEEYQIIIKYVKNIYEVYATADRASVMGKYQYENIFDAFDKFLNLMQLTVLNNRMRVKNGENPEYNCSLWGKEWLEKNKKH